jgi:O-antigen/teichoic acid export membrane protein
MHDGYSEVSQLTVRPFWRRFGGFSDRFFDYFETLVIGSGTRIFGLASQFVVLLILSRMLSKGAFGDMMAAFGFYRLASISLGLGGSLVVLFHVSRHPDDKHAEIKLHRFSAWVGGLGSLAVAVAGVFAASTVAATLGKPGLAVWLRELSPFVVFNTLLVISTGALEGRSRISASIALGELAPNVVRIVLLPIVVLLQLPEQYIAHVITLSVIIPWLWPAQRLADRSVSGLRPWTKWDYGYFAQVGTAMLFANQLGAVDILVANALFPSTVVADYAIASRLAGLFLFLQLAVLKRFAPAAARFIETQDFPALRREVELCRHLMIALGSFSIAGILFLSPFVLPIFGKYASADIILIWLAVPTFISCFYITSDRLLTVAGKANIILLFNGLSCAALIAVPYLVSPWLGITSIPAAMTVSVVVFNLIVVAQVQKTFAIKTIHQLDVALMTCGTLALAGYAFNDTPMQRLATCTVLVAIGAYYAFSGLKRREGVEVARDACTNKISS